MKSMPYGYISPGQYDYTACMRRGQNIAGYPVGIIYIEDVWYPYIPGNVVNGYTFSFPVRLMPVKGLSAKALFDREDFVEDAIISACQRLEAEGVRAISGACGFFGNYQDVVSEVTSVPTALSSLVQLNWIAPLLKSDEKIGVLTADKSSFSTALLDSCGISKNISRRLVVYGMEDSDQFSCVIRNFGSFNVAAACQELVDTAQRMVSENDGIAAILLECSDMPPFAAEVQQAVGLPVWDFTTLINWLYLAAVRKPYGGVI
ncbi:MAG: aspartate/glutamate racemase family protein [Lachnospiraceae bacterium]|nr:aspartate/glutamate racemase family protein [Lachnospiraceae bacterium]